MGIAFTVKVRDQNSAGRRGLLETPHGMVETPAFMPVGTYGAVKGMRAEDLEAVGAQIVLSNTYHLAERPGSDTIARLGGLHEFMGWKKPILTDSGGYQVMSLSRRCVVDDNGVTFQSPLDGSERMLTPENVVAIQAQLGSDVAMVLDVCVANPADRTTAEAALARTQEWAERSRPLVDDLPGGMFGIVQGSIYPDLRHSHAQQLSALDFPGYAIGGLSVGEPKEVTWEVLEAAVEGLPDDKPHYVMGMGTPLDLVEAVSRGADLFDCVMPTRHARNGVAFTGKGKISIKNSAYAEDPEPLDSNCACPTCRRYSRAYLRHLKMRSEMSGAILLTWHNLFHYLDSMRRIRHAIASGSLTDLLAEVRAAEEEMP